MLFLMCVLKIGVNSFMHKKEACLKLKFDLILFIFSVSSTRQTPYPQIVIAHKIHGLTHHSGQYGLHYSLFEKGRFKKTSTRAG